MADFENVIHLFIHACLVSMVAFVRPNESVVPADPYGTVVPVYLHDRAPSPKREETPIEGPMDTGLSTFPREVHGTSPNPFHIQT